MPWLLLVGLGVACLLQTTGRLVPRWYGDDSPHHICVGLLHEEQARLVKTVNVCNHHAKGLRIRPSVPARGNLGGPSG